MTKQEMLDKFTKEEILGLYLMEVFNDYFNDGFWPVRYILPKDAKIFFDAIKIQDHQDKWEEEESPPQLGWEISNIDELNIRATNNEFRT